MKTAQIRPNVQLHEFVVMPNHIHGIIQLLDTGRGELHLSDDNELHLSDDNRGVCKTPLRGPSQTIGAIVRGYKSSVTKQINLLCALDTPIKLWQRNYYDHIIRNEQSYQRILEYIISNPAKWEEDKFYKN